MATYKEYDIIDPGSTEELRIAVVQAVLDDSPLQITVREHLDELTARRSEAIEMGIRLEIRTFHTGHTGFAIVRLVNSDNLFGRIDYTADQLTLTMTESRETVVPTP